MTSFFASISLASISLVVVACGGDALDPGAGDDLGDGTGTLYVDGRASAEPRLVNATANDYDTEFSIRIGLTDQAVTTGTVTITSRLATTTLTYVPDATLGHWVGTAAGYDRVYQLDIVSGADEVRGVIVDGPDLHRITAPALGASLDSTIAHTLEWDRADAADITTFRAEETDRITISDTGTYSIPPGSLKADKDDPRTNDLELRRTNHVEPAGAIAGSGFAVMVEQRIEVVALANPAL